MVHNVFTVSMGETPDVVLMRRVLLLDTIMWQEFCQHTLTFGKKIRFIYGVILYLLLAFVLFILTVVEGAFHHALSQYTENLFIDSPGSGRTYTIM